MLDPSDQTPQPVKLQKRTVHSLLTDAYTVGPTDKTPMTLEERIRTLYNSPTPDQLRGVLTGENRKETTR